LKTLWNNIAMNSGATRYLDPTEEPPSEARYPHAHCIWRDNDIAICAYISSSTVSTKHEHFDHHNSAAAIWAALRARHMQQGPLDQVNNLRAAMDIRFSDDVNTWATMSEQIATRRSSRVLLPLPTESILSSLSMLSKPSPLSSTR
jgi:hypothetical protein